MARLGVVLAAFVGLALLLSGCGSVYDLPLPGGANVGSNPLTVHILFSDVLDLVPQSTVKVNDVSVGKVTAVDLQKTSTGCPSGGPVPCQVANVTVEIPRATKLPANALATIRQTSLLGEKFVSLSPPANPQGALVNGATIPLASTGANPEVEDVLKALGALLSGGGVGQLKLITDELNNAIGGKEAQVRSVLTQLHYFMGQLSASKTQIVTAVDNLNRLAVSLKAQDPTIVATLNDIPAALASVNRQRAYLVQMLTALNKLSGVGVRVIEASKVATINGLTDLAPVLSELAAAGNNLPKAFQIFLTYPFVDATVGTTPAIARTFEDGDYTNLSVNLDLNLANLALPGLPTTTLPGLIQLCKTTPLAAACTGGLGTVVSTLCGGLLAGTPACTAGTEVRTGGTTGSTGSKGSTGSSGSGSGGSRGGGGLLGGLGLVGLLGRTAYGSSGTVQRSSGDGMSFLLLEGAMQ